MNLKKEWSLKTQVSQQSWTSSYFLRSILSRTKLILKNISKHRNKQSKKKGCTHRKYNTQTQKNTQSRNTMSDPQHHSEPFQQFQKHDSKFRLITEYASCLCLLLQMWTASGHLCTAHCFRLNVWMKRLELGLQRLRPNPGPWQKFGHSSWHLVLLCLRVLQAGDQQSVPSKQVTRQRQPSRETSRKSSKKKRSRRSQQMQTEAVSERMKLQRN